MTTKQTKDILTLIISLLLITTTMWLLWNKSVCKDFNLPQIKWWTALFICFLLRKLGFKAI